MPAHSDHESPKGRRAPLALLVATGLVAVVAACGSSHTTGTAADPAGAVPADAPLYAGAIVRPDGSLKTAAAGAGRALTHRADPFLSLLAVLQTPGSAPLNFDRDVAPWLGPQAGIFLSSLDGSAGSGASRLLSLLSRSLVGGSTAQGAFPFADGASAASGSQGAIVLDTSDVAKARSFLDAQARRAGARAATYRGVAYLLTAGGLAFAIVDRFAVIGSEVGLHSVIDTALGGASLARASGYAKLLAVAPSGTLAHLYLNPRTPRSRSSAGAHGGSPPGGLSGSPSPSGATGASQGLSGLPALLAGARETNISLVPSASSIAVDADALASGSPSTSGGLIASVSEGAQAAGELPGDSWLAVGLGNVGATLGGDVKGLRSLTALGSALGGSLGGGSQAPSSGALSVNGLLEDILAPLSLLGADSAEARRDFASWMGSAGIFASGAGLTELRAGIVIASTNPALSRAAVPKLATLLHRAGSTVQPSAFPGAQASVAVYLNGFPITLNIVDARDSHGRTKFVIGLGEASVTAALDPPSTLSGAASTNAASAILGEGIQPSLTLDFPTFLGLLEAVGLSEDPTISKLVPYLRTLTVLSGGGKSLAEGIERFRMVLGLQRTS
jgi:Protein of unknown function (DUF3352)